MSTHVRSSIIIILRNYKSEPCNVGDRVILKCVVFGSTKTEYVALFP